MWQFDGGDEVPTEEGYTLRAGAFHFQGLLQPRLSVWKTTPARESSGEAQETLPHL